MILKLPFVVSITALVCIYIYIYSEQNIVLVLVPCVDSDKY